MVSGECCQLHTGNGNSCDESLIKALLDVLLVLLLCFAPSSLVKPVHCKRQDKHQQDLKRVKKPFITQD